MKRPSIIRSAILLGLLVACSDSPYEPIPQHLVGEYSGRAGQGFQTYDLFLAIDQVSDSVRGLWSLAFSATCATHDGPYSGTLQGDQLRLRLRPDEDREATLDLAVRVLPGDSVVNGSLSLVQLGTGALCFSDFASIRLRKGEVNGLPIGS